MVAGRLRGGEWAARLLVLLLILGLPAFLLMAGYAREPQVVEIHAAMPEQGGWSQDSLTAEVGQPLKLRLTSDDVVHGFAVGRHGMEPVEVLPGKSSQVTLTFDQPGTYTFYCTRWCGPNHWRMRGTIEVTGPDNQSAATATNAASERPLYADLGIDIDAPHTVDVAQASLGPLQQRPSAARGAALGMPVPPSLLDRSALAGQSPQQVWQQLRNRADAADIATANIVMSSAELWDLVAYIWRSQTTPEALAKGKALYAANCAACHGETGAGDGVMATEPGLGQQAAPADFSDPSSMLGASPALLQGKILRGGMGTGMPYWGPILTDEEVWALVDYLWTFQFDYEE